MSTKLGTLTLDLVARIGNFTAGMRQASSSAEREMGRASSSVNAMNGMLGKLAATAGAAFSINQIVNYADSYTGLQNRLKLVTASQAELNTAMNDTFTIAQKTASSWDSTAMVYQRFADNADRLGISLGKTAELTETVSKAISVSGGSAASAEAALMQFGQALASGVLRGEEFNSIAEQAPGLLKAIAKGMGVNIGALRAMAQDGKITGDVLVDALGKAKPYIDDLFNKTDFTISQSFTKLSNEVTKFVGEFDAATGASKTFVQGMTLLSENMSAVTNTMMIGGAYMAGTYIALLSATAVGYVRNTIEAVRYQIALAGMQANAVGATRSLVLLRAASSAALGVLFSPVGLGVALAGVAAGYLLMKDGADDSTKSLRENNESVDDAIKKYKELDEVKRRAQLVSEKANLRDLAKEYDEINSKLITATYSFSRHNDMTTEQSKQVNALVAEYKKTGDIEEFSKKINALSFINQTSKDRFNTLGGSVKDAGDQFKSQKTFVDQMAPAVKDVGDQAKQTAGEVAQLSEELKKLLGVNAEGTNKSNYLKEMVDLKVDPKLAEMLYEARKASGLIGSGKKLSDDVLKSVLERWRADKGLNKTLEERAKIEERNKKAIEAQGNAMKVNALVAANAAKANATALESAKNLPKGLLSAVNMVESPHSNSAKSGAGAGGPMQFMPPTADRYKVDINSVESSYRGASNYLKDLLKMFDGDMENALRAYNWGEGNMQNYLKYGSGMKKENGKWQKGYFTDKPMPKETREYSGKVMGYMAGSSGIKFNEEYSSDDWVKEQEKLVMEREKYEKEQAEKQKQLALEVATYKERVNTELADKIKEVNEAGFGEAETKRLTAEYQKRAAIDIQVSEAAHADKLAEYSAYVKTEEQLINESYDRRQRDLKLDLSLTHDEYTQASLNLETMRKRELEAIRRDQALELLEVKRDWMNREQYAEEYYALVRAEILATANYSPEKKSASIKQANAQQGVDQAQQREGIWADYTDRFAPEQLPYDQDAALLKAARDEMLITEEEYQKQRLALQMTYGAQYGADFAGMMMGLVDSSSSAHAVLGGIQKGAALFSTAMNSYTAISAAWASAPFPYNLPAVGMATMETGLLKAAVSAMSPAGMAHDGIDNIPKEGTWLLDKGERVVDSRTNADLKNMIANNSNGGPQININVPPGYTAEQSRGADGAVTIDIVEKRIKQSWGNLGNPNSFEAKQIQRNTTAGVKR